MKAKHEHKMNMKAPAQTPKSVMGDQGKAVSIPASHHMARATGSTPFGMKASGRHMPPKRGM